MNPLKLPQFLLPFFVFAIISVSASGQNSKNNSSGKITDKLFFGGGLGLQFGALTLIDVSPMVGYRVTEKFETGIGLTYKYYKYKDYYYDYTEDRYYDLKSNIIGGSVFARYHIIENIFAHAEFESLRYKFDDYYRAGGPLLSETNVANINSFFVGGGYRQRISGNSYFYIMGLWNLIDDKMSPYSNPVLRMGVALGL